MLSQKGVIVLRSFSGVSEECLRGVFRLLEEFLKMSCIVCRYLWCVVLVCHWVGRIHTMCSSPLTALLYSTQLFSYVVVYKTHVCKRPCYVTPETPIEKLFVQVKNDT